MIGWCEPPSPCCDPLVEPFILYSREMFHLLLICSSLSTAQQKTYEIKHLAYKRKKALPPGHISLEDSGTLAHLTIANAPPFPLLEKVAPLSNLALHQKRKVPIVKGTNLTMAKQPFEDASPKKKWCSIVMLVFWVGSFLVLLDLLALKMSGSFSFERHGIFWIIF